MKYFAVLVVISGLIFCSKADRLDDAYKYLDEVLTVHVPWAIEEARLELYEMPNFSYNFQNRSHDGGAVTGKIYYHSGNLTGLQNVYRKSCKQPRWTFGNITIYCNIVFPEITVKYEGRLQLIGPVPNAVNIRQLDFGVKGTITDMEAAIVISTSPHIGIPTIKDLTSIDAGRPSFSFNVIEDYVSYETVISHFYHKFNELFLEAFYDKYKKAFERAVESIPYPTQ